MKILAPRELLGLGQRAVKSWIGDNASSMGAALAFYTLFSIAPLLLVSLAVAGVFVDRATAQHLLLTQLTNMVGDNAATAIAALLQAAGSRNTRFPAVIGLVVLALGATSVFVQLRMDLDLIWRCEPPKSGGVMRFVATRARSFAMIAVVGLLLLVSVVASTALEALGGRLFAGSQTLAHAADFGLSFLVVTGLFAMIYKMLPSTRIAWGDVWVGAAVTSLLFYIGKILIALYIAKASPASSFGAAGTVVVVIVWVYYSAQIFFLGAEFTREYALRHGSKRNEATEADAVPPVAANEEHLVHRAEKIVRGEDPVLLNRK